MMRAFLLILFLGIAAAQAGSPARAKQITKAYDTKFSQWVDDVGSADGPALLAAAWARKPDPMEAARAVWTEMRGDLDKAWILEPAAWLLIEMPEFATKGGKRSPAAALYRAVMANHLRSPKVGPYCIALTEIGDPKARKLLEMVEKVNEDQAVQGAAALAQAIILRRTGQGKLGMRLRQEKIRKAITAPDLTVGKTTTLALAQDEVFRMTRLNQGTEAPNFRGVEVDQKVSSLSDYRGKVTILFFWHTQMTSYQESLELFRKYQGFFSPEEVVILGVNIDNPLTLRRLIADEEVTWRNFSDSARSISKLYRNTRWPFVYVLDRDHKIRYSGDPGSFVQAAVQDLVRPTKAAE